MGKRSSLVSRLTQSVHSLDAADLEDEAVERRCTHVTNCSRGDTVEVSGRLQAVVYTPSETVPTLVATLFDGTDTLTLVWLGRRRIAGIEPGRKLHVRGRVGRYEGNRAIYNPWYELICPAA